MLNLTVAMKRFVSLIFLFGILATLGFVIPENIIVNNPQPGESVQGVVEITGSVVSDYFSSCDVYYSYGNSENETWFLIAQTNQKVENDVIARWDTTTITDGEYQIKVKLVKSDNSIDELIVKPVFVRNYSPEPTIAPVSTKSSIETQENESNSTGYAYATPFPQNPAAASYQSIKSSVIIGIVSVVLIFAALLGYRYFFNHNHLK